MKIKLFSFLAVVAIILAVGCSGGAEGDAQIAATFRIDSIVSEGDTNEIAADMINADDGITADFATITVSNYMKNPNATPSVHHDVRITSYDVSFTRSDGGTVFESFSGGLSALVPVNETASFNVVVVRLSEKTSGALAGWRAPVLDMDAHITLHGVNGSGDSVTASGSIKVAPGNYGDDTANLAPAIGSFIANRSEAVDGQSVTVSWYISGVVNQIILNPGDIELNVYDNYPYGSYTFTGVDFPQTFTLMVGGLDGFASSEVDVDEATGQTNQPVITLFDIQPETVGFGESATMSWAVSNADTVTIYPNLGAQASLNGEITVSPDYTTTYTLLAQNAEGISTETATLSVGSADPQIVFFTGNNDEVNYGGVIHLNWAVQGNYDRLELFPFYAEPDDILDVSGLYSMTTEAILADTTFVLTAYGQGKIVNATFDVSVITTSSARMAIQKSGDSAWDVTHRNFEDVNYHLFTAAGDPLLFNGKQGTIHDGQGVVDASAVALSDRYGYSVVQIVATDQSGDLLNRYDFRVNRTGADVRPVTMEADGSLTNSHVTDVLVHVDEALLGGRAVIQSVSGEQDVLVRTEGSDEWHALKTGYAVPVTSTTLHLQVRDAGQASVSDHVAIMAAVENTGSVMGGEVVVLKAK